ncbi:GRIP and coiled-coil domain-containing protein 2, partial [Lamellibrachia satsuma]
LLQLLNESEATVMRLTEQAKILKEEVRRQERNQQRETAVSNMEYLKNVVFKFLTLSAEDEKTQLIPVLTTMLRLSADEVNILKESASG